MIRIAAAMTAFFIICDTALAAEITYEDVASTPCPKFGALAGTAMFAAPSEALAEYVLNHFPKQSDGYSACNINEMILSICKRHRTMTVGEAVKFFVRGRNLPSMTRCGA